VEEHGPNLIEAIFDGLEVLGEILHDIKQLFGVRLNLEQFWLQGFNQGVVENAHGGGGNCRLALSASSTLQVSSASASSPSTQRSSLQGSNDLQKILQS
jgi:hypothetical protein